MVSPLTRMCQFPLVVVDVVLLVVDVVHDVLAQHQSLLLVV